MRDGGETPISQRGKECLQMQQQRNVEKCYEKKEKEEAS